MEDTASHETVYKLAHRADKANFSSFCYLPIVTIVQGREWGHRQKFDKLLTDVVVLRLSQAAKREVGGRRTETE